MRLPNSSSDTQPGQLVRSLGNSSLPRPWQCASEGCLEDGVTEKSLDTQDSAGNHGTLSTTALLRVELLACVP